ncbi:hypothetical protein AB0O91_06545 [Kitasatospora sp. NPDC089797]|uniref:hypothetical protein n=1 Tax=Kitasatospora sp. NPDC089797 TaxID=3155298 RepID=UPI0034153552
MRFGISASAVLGIVIVLRLMRRTESRSRVDEKLTAFLCVTFGVLIAATPWGHAILRLVGVAVRATH